MFHRGAASNRRGFIYLTPILHRSLSFNKYNYSGMTTFDFPYRELRRKRFRQLIYTASIVEGGFGVML